MESVIENGTSSATWIVILIWNGRSDGGSVNEIGDV
nr:hypothetical protein PPFHPHBJ_00059 [Cydia pomonella granulovirus]WOZ44835.1 hypothetical protein HDNAPKKO_00061 [Cydia pomonella granulovirus]WOZ44971.1 hypothetical protein GGGKFHNK_00059 [Cydia pomonella granulovirus]WOZ45107.1 hypothetical protein BGFFOGFG_00059 [Cydia pomonella granulovirus]WOZ45628.1 hypothetical protein AAGMHLIN_00057 [Cydia pomonella granulovirus]